MKAKAHADAENDAEVLARRAGQRVSWSPSIPNCPSATSTPREHVQDAATKLTGQRRQHVEEHVQGADSLVVPPLHYR